MKIKDIFRRKPDLDPKNVTNHRDAMKVLRLALDRQEKRLRDIGGEVVDVQLVGQVTTAAEWPQLLAYWEKRYPLGDSHVAASC